MLLPESVIVPGTGLWYQVLVRIWYQNLGTRIWYQILVVGKRYQKRAAESGIGFWCQILVPDSGTSTRILCQNLIPCPSKSVGRIEGRIKQSPEILFGIFLEQHAVNRVSLLAHKLVL